MESSIHQEPLLIEQLEITRWFAPTKRPAHYQLVLIQTGMGELVTYDNRFAYQAGDVFFLSPSDTYRLNVFQRTRLCRLSFTSAYIGSLSISDSHACAHIHAYGATLSSAVITNPTEQRNLRTLVDIIVAEQRLCPLLANPVVESLMKTILNVLDRHLAQYSSGVLTRSTAPSGFVQRIVTYIGQHITEPDLLRMDKLADVFNYSASHLAALFKQQVGESIQQYIIRYKLKQVENRLSLSTMTISQIADEFGFSDVCHLNKLFKRYYQHTPTNYRRNLALF